MPLINAILTFTFILFLLSPDDLLLLSYTLVKGPKVHTHIYLIFFKGPKVQKQKSFRSEFRDGNKLQSVYKQTARPAPPCVTMRGRHRRRNLALLPPLSPLPPPHRWKAGRRSNMVVVGPNCGGSRRGAE